MANKRSNPFLQFLFSIVLGGLFILSGILKIASINELNIYIQQFKMPFLIYVAPYISVIEIYIGARLFFMFKMKMTGFLSFALIIILTLFYLYGYYVFRIQECLCFGKVKFLNTQFIHILIRNGLMLIISIYLWASSSNEKVWYTWKKTIMALAFIVPAVAVSMVMKWGPVEEKIIPVNEEETEGMAEKQLLGEDVNKTFLGLLNPTSSDSTYLIFIYSANCEHCVSSIESINMLYEKRKFDNVIGIAPNSESDSLLLGVAYPEFKVLRYPETSIQKVASKLPATFVIVNDTIRVEEYRAVTSAYYFMLRNRDVLSDL